MTIQVKLIEKGLDKIAQAHPGEWYDLRAAEDTYMIRGEVKNIRLGVAIKLPEGYEAIVVPRSSTYKNYGLMMVNSVGVIDNAYSGNGDEWHFPALATRSVKINKGDRICQFRIIPQQPHAEIVYVDDLGDQNRGGFGSTGIE